MGSGVVRHERADGVLLAIWVSRSITGPVGRLVGLAKRIATGDLNIKPQPRRDDELGVLSDAISQMSTDLSILIEKDKQSLEMRRLVKELELLALQNQINPHFLFNTLNVLSKLAILEGAENQRPDRFAVQSATVQPAEAGQTRNSPGGTGSYPRIRNHPAGALQGQNSL